MDVQYVNPFVLAIKRVFETMVRTTVKVGKPYVKNDNCATADVSGVIGFSGDAAGCVVLSFPGEVAAKAASAFAGIAITDEHPDFADAVGELANMVAGNAKKEFHGMNISISLPSVIIGKSHVVSLSQAAPRIVIPCETEYGPVYVEVAMVTGKRSVSKQPAALAGV